MDGDTLVGNLLRIVELGQRGLARKAGMDTARLPVRHPPGSPPVYPKLPECAGRGLSSASESFHRRCGSA